LNVQSKSDLKENETNKVRHRAYTKRQEEKTYVCVFRAIMGHGHEYPRLGGDNRRDTTI
jgi:hypothetical protein